MTVDELAKVIAEHPGLSVEFSWDSSGRALVLRATHNLPDGGRYADCRRLARETMEFWPAASVATELERLVKRVGGRVEYCSTLWEAADVIGRA